MSGYESPPIDGGYHPNTIPAASGVDYGDLPLAIRNKLAVAFKIEEALGDTYVTGSLALYLHQRQNNTTGTPPRDLDIVHVVKGRVTTIPNEIAGWTESNTGAAWASPVLRGSPAGVTYRSQVYDFPLDVITTTAQSQHAKVLNNTVWMFKVRVITLAALKRFYESDANDDMSPLRISASEKVKQITELQEGGAA
jgi:hypothetical protein